MDKEAKFGNPRGAAYCDTKGTSCVYGEGDICVNCGRPKGWRLKKRIEADNLRRGTDSTMVYDPTMTCLCRYCKKSYPENKATADFKGYCTMRCQHAKAKELGWKPKGARSEYSVLKINKQIGSVLA